MQRPDVQVPMAPELEISDSQYWWVSHGLITPCGSADEVGPCCSQRTRLAINNSQVSELARPAGGESFAKHYSEGLGSVPTIRRDIMNLCILKLLSELLSLDD